MFKTVLFSLMAMIAFSMSPLSARAQGLEIGKPAPDFKTKDIHGTDQSLSQYKGKIVVLEWTNPGCPFVKKHYDSKNMQSLQKEMTDQGIVWLTINSSALGKQGNQTNEEAIAYTKEVGSSATARIADANGAIGTLYHAKTTPHIFIVDATGLLAYQGAIDDIDSTDPADTKTANNYVRAAVADLMAGKAVTTAQTKPYGCGVKY